MGRRAAATSAGVEGTQVRGRGRTHRSAKTARLRQMAHAASGDGDPSLDKDPSAGPIGPITGSVVTDDLPEFAVVGDRELDAIEAHLGALLDELRGRLT